ncbi:MAG TPA: hypothetical protein V6C86_24330 [Oculatellaceae cyanobacterium]
MISRAQSDKLLEMIMEYGSAARESMIMGRTHEEQLFCEEKQDRKWREVIHYVHSLEKEEAA